MKVNILIPCFIDQFSPQTGFNMIKVLEKAGCKVHYHIEQTCCGMPAFNAGRWSDAREVGEKFLNETTTDKPLVCGASACTGVIRNSYDLLFQNSSFHVKYRNLQKQTFELSEFLVDVLKFDNFGAVLNKKAFYMPSCQARNVCKTITQPLQLLKNIEGLELINIDFENECCGFGGMFSVNNPELSFFMGKQIIDKVMNAGADSIISTDYACLMHLKAICTKQQLPINILHIADVLANF
ncbi:MAG: (Fe-S)-binding protein [Bacteroidia bacterium]